MTKWTMQSEAGTQITISAGASLRLAFDCGYRWINRNDGQGWKQLSLEVRKAEIAASISA